MARPKSVTPTVHLRTKPIGKGLLSQYLEIYRPSTKGKGRRSYEFLGRDYYLTGVKKDDDRRRASAESVRAARESEIVKRHHGGGAIDVDRSTRILDYWDKTGERNASHPKARAWLERYEPEATFRDVSARWFDGFGESMASAVVASGGKGSKHGTRRQADHSWKGKGKPVPVMSRNTARQYMEVLCSVLRRAMIDELVTPPLYEKLRDVLKEKKWKRRQAEIFCLSADQLRALYQTPNNHPTAKPAFLFAVFAGGLRLSDIEALRWQNIDRQRCELRIRQQKTGEMITVPFPEHGLQFLPTDPDDPEAIVFDIGNRSRLWRALRRWGRDAKLPFPLHFHVARHTHATLALEGGADVLTVSKLLGHADVSTTARYLHIVDQRKRDAVERLPKLGEG